MKKAITPVVATILLLLITVAVVGFTFTFFSGMLSTTTESSEEEISHQMIQMGELFRIENTNENNVSIRNTGTSVISGLAFFVDDEKKDATSSCPGGIQPGQVCHFEIQDVTLGNHELKVSGSSRIVKSPIEVTSGTTTTTLPSGLSASFSSPTDPNGASVTRDWTYVNTSVFNLSAIDTFRINWNGTDVNVYDSSLALAMNLNGNTNDWSKYGNDGTNNGADCSASVTGRFGTACSFDGNDYVNTNHDFSWTKSDSFTIEAWVKTNTIASGYGVIISKVNYEYSLRRSGSSIAFIYWDTGGSNEIYLGSGNGALSVDEWTHVAVAYDGSEAKLYINGMFNFSDSIVTDTLQNRAENTLIGYGYTTSGGHAYWNGAIDEVRFYNRALSAEEINATYNAELGRYVMNQTGLADGTYTYYAWVNDTVGNIAQTETRTIHVG